MWGSAILKVVEAEMMAKKEGRHDEKGGWDFLRMDAHFEGIN
jgi:hypothetical protein